MTLTEFEESWSWLDACEAHWVLDELDKARRAAQAEADREARKNRGKRRS